MRFSRFASSIVFLALLTSGATVAEAQQKKDTETKKVELKGLQAQNDVEAARAAPNSGKAGAGGRSGAAGAGDGYAPPGEPP